MLYTARFAQGAGTAMMMPQIVSVIQAQFAGTARAKALSAYSPRCSRSGERSPAASAACWSAADLSAQAGAGLPCHVPMGLAVIGCCADHAGDEARGHSPPRSGRVGVDRPGGVADRASTGAGHQEGLAGVDVRRDHRRGGAGRGLLPDRAAHRRQRGRSAANVAVLRIPGVGSGLTTLAMGMVAYGGFLFSVALHPAGRPGRQRAYGRADICPGRRRVRDPRLLWRKFPRTRTSPAHADRVLHRRAVVRRYRPSTCSRAAVAARCCCRDAGHGGGMASR